MTGTKMCLLRTFVPFFDAFIDSLPVTLKTLIGEIAKISSNCYQIDTKTGIYSEISNKLFIVRERKKI